MLGWSGPLMFRSANREGADQTFMALTGRPWMDETLGAAR
jgi:hypothetical protein